MIVRFKKLTRSNTLEKNVDNLMRTFDENVDLLNYIIANLDEKNMTQSYNERMKK